MSLLIDLPPEIERWLRDAANQEGLDPSAYLTRIVERERRETPPPTVSSALSPDESELLLQINLGIPGETWERYRELIQLRRAEALTDAQQQELIGISDQIEAANARRIEQLGALAQIRHTTIRNVMDQLGIPRGTYACGARFRKSSSRRRRAS